MVPNTSRATMPPAAHPANDAESRIALVSASSRSTGADLANQSDVPDA